MRRGPETLKDGRDRAILPRRGVLHLRVHGKDGKVRYLPLHPGAAELVTDSSR
jgi:hypothetical protein